jgi:hypothetical protein
LLTGCLSTNKIAKKNLSEMEDFSKENLEGIYLNRCDTEDNNKLWKELYYSYHLFKADKTDIPEKTFVKLELNNPKNLTVTLISTEGEILNSFSLKGKIIDKYFSVKRNFFLIPIPAIFLYRERKILIGNSKDGNLILAGNDTGFAWILIISGGNSPFVTDYKFDKR